METYFVITMTSKQSTKEEIYVTNLKSISNFYSSIFLLNLTCLIRLYMNLTFLGRQKSTNITIPVVKVNAQMFQLTMLTQ